MDVLANYSIFQELQLVHDTGYFSAMPSLEENWQQMTSMIVTDVAPQPSSLPQSQMYDDDDRCPLNTLQEMTKTTPKEATLHEPCCDGAGPSNVHQMTKITPKEATLHEPCCDGAGPSNIHQMTKITPKEATLHEPCCDGAGPSNIHQNLEVTHSDLSVEYVPRLRRTKSIFMKDIVPEDSDELFYSTPSSGDDFIPDTTSKSDTDSERSIQLNTPSMTKHLYFNDVAAMDSPICDSTTRDKIGFDRPSHSSQDLEQDPCAAEESCFSEKDQEPGPSGERDQCSSQRTGAVVVCPSKKKGGKRVYDKRHYCLYCSKPYAKIARHLEHAHCDKSDVARAVSFAKGSTERKMQLDYIRNKGNYAHNASVMESGKGELVAFKRPPKEAQGNDFMHCVYCQGLFLRKVLWRHMRKCTLKPGSVAPMPGKSRVQALCTYAGPVPASTSEELWRVIAAMNPGPISHIIRNDQVIVDFGQHLLNKRGTSAKNKELVRQKMRELGRLIQGARRVTSLKNMEDLINPVKYMQTVQAVKATCGYDSESNSFLVPSLANKLGHSLVKISRLLKAKGLLSNDEKLVKNATNFEAVHQEKWHELISATALRNIREAKWNVPSVMPFTKDVQKLHAYLTQEQDKWHESLSEYSSTKAWKELTKVCVVQLILFNRRREGEVSSMPLSAFVSRDPSDPHEDVDWALSDMEKKLCRHFTRIVIRGKRGRPVPILITPKMLSAIELLVSKREACGVLKDNKYLFARPGAMTHFRGSDCFRTFAMQCGAECPRALTSTKLRKHAATLSTVLNLTNTEMDQLANFLGHDIRVHREYYRLPEKTLQLAKISKLLMALEQGRVAEFHGKTLDEIEIDPNEKLLENDEDNENMLSDDGTPMDETETGDIIHKRSKPHKRCKPPSSDDDEQPSGVGSKKCSSKGKRSESDDPCLLTPKRRTPFSNKDRPSSDDDDEIPSSIPAKRSSFKGKRKRTPWQETEIKAVERHMMGLIKSFCVPGKRDCERCLRAEPEALKTRDWQTLKYYVYNRISAAKKKLQHK